MEQKVGVWNNVGQGQSTLVEEQQMEMVQQEQRSKKKRLREEAL